MILLRERGKSGESGRGTTAREHRIIVKWRIIMGYCSAATIALLTHNVSGCLILGSWFSDSCFLKTMS